MVRNSNNGSQHSVVPRARRRAEARRLEILRAAGRAFRRAGFAATGMRQIAAEADLSPGNLYHYFRGKHELLYFCQDRALGQMLAALQAAGRAKGSHAERLGGVIEAHVRCLLDEVEGSAAHLEIDALPLELRRAIVVKRDRYERGFCRLVAAGVRSREFAPCDPKFVTRAMLGAINWTARWFRADGPRPAQAVAAEVAEFLIRGLVGRAVATGHRAWRATGGAR